MTRSIVAALVGISLVSFPSAQTREPPGSADIPLVRAEPGPAKVKPADPGGLKVPHADKTIYERIETRRKPELRKEHERPAKYRIHLGPFDDAQAAQQRWRGLQRDHGELVGSLQSRVEKTEAR